VHDPYVAEYPGVPIVPFVEEAVRDADAIVIFAGHHLYKDLDPAYLKNLTGKKHPVIVDGRNLADPDTYIRLGFIYKGIGRGDKNGHEIVD
jgi:UDP-N-acetyl-D-mannosaminuronic acid dehydrogenase